ncbi:fungal hydrophobin-domain-containing protein [Roridomyces roridus]|uniref:Fungal hydrophobin-domain-containing protein n=1 Tax=Roridomyces roridus TaxID=1738132 RepID=A0AAD7C8S8_9AGAR|nr:fungal hydrophobin-domain-containing protein [Roridomyces roridus]
MQFTAFGSVLIAFFSMSQLTSASPAGILEERQFNPCAGLTGVPQCCALGLLGVAALDCAAPNPAPTNAASFTANCAAVGKQTACCVLPVLGQGILCASSSATVRL